MTTKLHKAYSKNKNAYYYFKCDCSNMFIARNDANPKSCGCLIGKPKTVDIETNINQIESYLRHIRIVGSVKRYYLWINSIKEQVVAEIALESIKKNIKIRTKIK